jgi:hypothetical protein
MALGITDAVSISGRLVELAKTTMTLELREQILELRAAVLNAQEETLSLREQLGELKCAAQDRKELTFDGYAYWRTLADGKREGPFCQRCFDSDSKAIYLQKTLPGMPLKWSCTACSAAYLGP